MSIIRRIQSNVPDCTYHVNVGLASVKSSLEQFNVNLDPVYQRDYVWAEDQKIKFVGAAIENPKAMPPFWFNWVHDEFDRSSSEVVDGKQRLNACISWLDGEIPAVCPCGETVWFKDLNEIDIRLIDFGFSFSWNFVDLNKKEVMKFYIRLNSGGTIHSGEDLDKVKKLIGKAD